MNGSDLDRHIFGDYDQPDDLTYGEGYEDGYQEGRADGYSAGYDAAIDALRARAERAEAVVAEAPHADDCIGWFQTLTIGVHDGTCDCWKADYARASQPASEVEQ